MEVVTFGAPRVGNSAFVTNYNSHVKDTWYTRSTVFHTCCIVVSSGLT